MPPTTVLAVSNLVSAAPPSISKAFDDASILVGGTTTLRFTIGVDATPQTNLTFTDTLPAGLVVAAVPATTDNCFGAVTAPPGGNTISYLSGTPPTNVACFSSTSSAMTRMSRSHFFH